MYTRITVILVDIPKLARDEYHPDQVMLYSKFTELMFKALNLPSIAEFMENLAKMLSLEKVNVLVMRLPPRRSWMGLVKKEDGIHIIREELHGISVKKRDMIIVFPDLLYPSRLRKPFWRIGIRGCVLNSMVRAVIHEMLHKSGVKDENEVRKLTDQHYKGFRRTYLSRFEAEFKPLLKEWKRIEKDMGLH
jgi:hypothetical protein